MENEHQKKNCLTFRSGVDTKKADIGLCEWVDIASCLEALPAELKECVFHEVPLAPYENRFERELESKIHLWQSQWKELEDLLQTQEPIDFTVKEIKNKTALLSNDQCPSALFYLEAKSCASGMFPTLKPGMGVTTKIIRIDRKLHLVYTSNLQEGLSFDSLCEEDINRVVMVKATFVNPDMGVFVDYKGLSGLIKVIGLHFKGDWEHYRQQIGKEIKVYIYDINKKDREVCFSENSLKQTWQLDREREIDIQPGDEIEGIPTAFHFRNGLFVLYKGFVGLVPRKEISGDLWKKLPDIYTLGTPTRFLVKSVDAERCQFTCDFHPQVLSDSDAAELRLIREISEDLPVGTVVDVIPLSRNDSGIIARKGIYSGLLPNWNMPECVKNVARSIVAAQIPLRVKVEEYNKQYSFNMMPVLEERMKEFDTDTDLLKMRIVAQEGMHILFSHASGWWGEFKSNHVVWKNMHNYIPACEINEEVEVRVLGVNAKDHVLSVDLLPTSYNIWNLRDYRVGELMRPTSVLIEREAVRIVYEHLKGTLLPETLIPGKDYAQEGVVESLLLVAFSQKEGLMYLADQAERFVGEDDLAGGLDVAYDLRVVRKIGKQYLLTTLDDKWAILHMDNEAEMMVGLLACKDQDPGSIGARVKSISDNGIVIFVNTFEVDGNDYSPLVRKDEMELVVLRKEPQGYLLGFAGLTGILPYEVVSKCDVNCAVGQSVKVRFSVFGKKKTFFYFDLISAWEKVHLAEGDVIEVAKVGYTQYMSVSYQGIIGIIYPEELTLLEGYPALRAIPDGSRLKACVTRFDTRDKTLVLSYREWMLQQWELAVPVVGQSCAGLRVVAVSPDYSLRVDYNGFIGYVPREELGWGNPEIAVRLYPVGTVLTGIVTGVDTVGYLLSFRLDGVQENVWDSYGHQLGEVVRAKILRVSQDSLMLDVDGALSYMNILGMSALAGKHDELTADEIPWKEGDCVDVRINRLNRDVRKLVVGPVEDPVFLPGETYDMSVLEVREEAILLKTYYGHHYTLPTKEISWLPMPSIKGMIKRGKKLRVKILDETSVSMKVLMPNPWETWCEGSQFEANVYAVIDRAVIFTCHAGLLEVCSCRLLHVVEELCQGDVLKRIFKSDRTFTLRVSRLVVEEGFLDVEVVMPVARTIDRYTLLCGSGDRYLAQGQNGCWGAVSIKEDKEPRGQVWLAVKEMGEEGCLLLTDDLENHPPELLGTILSCTVLEEEENYIILQSSTYDYLQVRMLADEWSWDASSENASVEVGMLVDVKVIGVEPRGSCVYVSRRRLLADSRSFGCLEVGDVCGVTVTDLQMEGYTVEGADYSGLLPFKECSWANLFRWRAAITFKRVDIFSVGDRLPVFVLDKKEEGREVVVSARRVFSESNPWEQEEFSQWSPGDILHFTVVRVTSDHLFLSYGAVVVPLIMREIYWQTGHVLSNDYFPGQRVEAKITEVKAESGLLKLSIKDLKRDPWVVGTLPKVGDVVEGQVNKVANRCVFLDCGGWIGKVMPDDLVWGILPDKEEPYAPGQRLRCRVEELHEEERVIRCNIRAMLDRPKDPYPIGEVCLTTVTSHAFDRLCLSYQEFNGILKVEDSGLDRKELEIRYPVASEIWAYLREVDYARHQLIFSLVELDRVIKVNEVIPCVVTEVLTSGIYVCFNHIPVFIPVEELTWMPRLAQFEYFFPVGKVLEARITHFNPCFNEIELSVKGAYANPWLSARIAVGERITVKVYYVSIKQIYFFHQGVLGKIPYSEALWQIGYKLVDHFPVDKEIECEVTDFSPETYTLKASVNKLRENIFDHLPFGEGDVVEGKVVRVSNASLFIEVDGVLGCIPLEDICWVASDDVLGTFHVGQKLRAKCIRLICEKRTIHFSLKELLDPKEIYELTVTEVTSGGVEVDFFGIRITISTDELFWTLTPFPNLFFKEGDRVNVCITATEDPKVLSVKRVYDNPWLKGFTPGMDLEGVVAGVSNKILYVNYQGLLVKIPMSEVFWQSGYSIKDKYGKGQAVRFRITEVDDAAQSVKGSVKALQGNVVENLPFKQGDTVKVSVAYIGETGIRVRYGEGFGYIPVEEIAWKTEDRKSGLGVGQEISALCTGINLETCYVYFSVRRLMENPMVGFEVGTVVAFVVEEVTEQCLIGTSGGKRIWVNREDTSWKYSTRFAGSLSESYKPGMALEAVVVGVDYDKEECRLSMKEKYPDPCMRYSQGDRLKVSIASLWNDVSIAKNGSCNLYVVEWGDYYGMLHRKDAHYQKAPRLNFVLGEQVEVEVMDIDRERNCLVFSAKIIYSDPFENLSLREGERVTAHVVCRTDDGLIVQLGNHIRAFIPLRYVSNRMDIYRSEAYQVGRELSASIEQINSEKRYVSLQVSHDSLPRLSPLRTGDICSVRVLSESKDGATVLTEHDWIGWIGDEDIGYKRRLEFKDRTPLDGSKDYKAKVIGYTNDGILLMSFRALISDPYTQTKPGDTIYGRVVAVKDEKIRKGYVVEFEQASGFLDCNNVTWKTLDSWKNILEIGSVYSFKNLFAKDEMFILTCLEDLPFDENGIADGVIVGKDETKVYIDVDGIVAYVDQNDDSLHIFNTALGGRDIREGRAVKVKLLKVEYKTHTIRVRFVSVVS